MARTIVIGLDGLDPSMVSFLPSMASLRVYRMDSLVPLTYPSWSTILTGVNPGKHGLLDFFDVRLVDGRLEKRLLSTYDLAYPRFFDAIRLSGARGKVRFAVVNPIPSYPLTPVSPRDGLVVSLDFFTPKPAASDEKLASKYYDLGAYWREVRLAYQGRPPCKRLYHIYLESIRAHRAALEQLVEDFDVVWMSLQIPDAFLHKCQGEVEGGPLLRGLLSEADSLIKKALDSSGNVIVVSDHGFKMYEGRVRVNAVLYREGLIVKTKDGGLEGPVDAPNEGIVLGPRWYRLGARLARGPLRRAARGLLRIAGGVVARVTGKPLILAIDVGVDYSRSKAFMPGWSSREPARYYVVLNDESVADKVVEVLRRVGLSAYKPSDLFHGPYTPSDKVVVYGGRMHPVVGRPDDEPIAKGREAQHARYGVIGLRLESAESLPGGDVLPGYVVAPLVLCHSGAPIDEYMDGYQVAAETCGRVEKEGFRGRWLAFRNLLARRARAVAA